MELYDISILVNSHTPVWPGDPEIKVTTFADRAGGDLYHTTQIKMGTHCGTHLDAPFHFIQDGKKLPQIPLSNLVLKTRVVEYTDNRPIHRQFLREVDLHIDSLLFKTRNSFWFMEPGEPFHSEFVALSLEAAQILAQSPVKLVGIDYLSIEPYGSKGHPIHHLLLGREILILEGICLAGVSPGDYQLLCLPLKVDAPDAAPVRAVLIKS